MAKYVNPALFIGLGGTGHKVLLQVKRSLLKNYGEIPPVINMLCFDTDRKELLSSQIDASYNKKNKEGFQFVKEKIKFDQSEAIGITVKNPLSLLKYDYIKAWLSDIIAPQIGPSDTGAKQIRQMGRFAIFENYKTQDIKGVISERITALKKVEIGKIFENYSFGDEAAKPCIHLVFSPCGGTGAGSFIDMIMIIKSIDQSIPVYGYMVMPDFYTSFPMTNSVIKNAYASLIEIDHLMGQDATTKKNWSNYSKNPYEADYTGNGQKLKLPGGSTSFFEYLYLFDNINEKGKAILKVDHVYERIARILYLMVSGPGTSMQSAYSNNVDYNIPSSDVFNRKRRNYSSMGISQIILDKNYLFSLKVNQVSKAILNAYCFYNEEIDTNAINTFIDSNSWREDNGKDMVIDRLMPRNQLKIDLESLYPPKFKKECNIELSSNVEGFYRQWDEKTKVSCKKVKDELYDDFKVKVKEQIISYLVEKGGLTRCKQFIAFLMGSFQGMGDEMASEVNTHKSNLVKLQKDVSSYMEAIVMEENSFNPLGKEKRIKEACLNFVQNSEKIVIEKWQIERKETAKLFYDMSLEFLKTYQKQINNIEVLVIETLTDIERETQNLLNSVSSEFDFERYIHSYYKEILVLDDDDINLEEAFHGINFTELFKLNKIADIKNLIYNYSRTTEAVKTINGLTVEKILDKLPKETINNMISYLDSSSAVCIDVDQSFLLQTGKASMEKFGYICVENKNETLFRKGTDIYKNLSSEGGYTDLNVYSTGDPNTITMIKAAGMFPAAAIKRISDYKEQFEVSVENGGYHFSDIYFEKNAMDLIDGPNDDEGEGFKWFVVGSALGKIYLYRGGIHLEHQNQKMIPLSSGTRGKTDRVECSKFFAQNKDYQKYIEDEYNNLLQENKPKLIEKFVNHYKNITSVEILGKEFRNIDRQSSEYDNIYEERRVLKQFGMANGIPAEKFVEDETKK